jgi:hypothetical protein
MSGSSKTDGRIRRRWAGVTEPLEHDWPLTMRYHCRRPVIDAEYRVVRQRPAIGYLSCVLIIGVATVFLLRFAWPALVMAFVLVGVTSPGTMVAVVIGAVIVAAAALRERLSGRPFWRNHGRLRTLSRN